MAQQLRIIGGQFRRRVLTFAAIDGLRPTPDRVRETLFNWLMWDINQARVLDVCAGSGALGFEAISRGAAEVVMIEPNRQQVSYLQNNARLLNTPAPRIMATTAEQALPELSGTFDVIFLDPPYALELWSSLSQLLQPLLHEQSRIYVEANRSLSELGLPHNWHLLKSTRAGQVNAGLFTYQP